MKSEAEARATSGRAIERYWDLLQWQPDRERFRYYDEFDPLRTVVLHDGGSDGYSNDGDPLLIGALVGALPDHLAHVAPVWSDYFTADEIAAGKDVLFFLLVNEARTDRSDPDSVIHEGNAILFGDGGHDWIVDGTGSDWIFGGWGDDYLTADDDPYSTWDTADPLANNIPDVRTSEPSFADIVFGGAGRDVLVANTGADRLIDWVGEFNSYIVPFRPFGNFTVSRQVSPRLIDWLYALGEAAGADTQAGVRRGGTEERNGEPFGQLGLVTQRDDAWNDQTGPPHDPQPGNHPGSRDVLREEQFDDATTVASSTAVESGTWTLRNERLESEATADEDAVIIFYVDHQLPLFHEILAAVSADPDRAGRMSNAYIVFDYQSPTDFKFAGIDIATNKVQIGQRTASGWNVLAQVNQGLQASRTYTLMAVIDGQFVTLFVDGNERVSHQFSTELRDPEDPFSGFADPLNNGYIGIGSANSITHLSWMSVRALAPVIVGTITETFDASTTYEPASGSWTQQGGTYTGTATADGPAISIAPTVQVAPGSLISVTATLRTATAAGLVFDFEDLDRFKYAMVDVAGQRVVLGYHTADEGWIEVVSAGRSLPAGADIDLELRLHGATATVLVGGVEVLTHTFSRARVNASYGLLVPDGDATVSQVVWGTDDPMFITDVPAMTIGSVEVPEGAEGDTTVVQVPVDLSFASDEVVTVQFRTEDGTAIAGEDYVALQGTLEFQPGETRAWIEVEVIGNDLPEQDKAFFVVLSDAVGARLVSTVGTVTVLNDDFLVSVSVEATVAEVARSTGDSGEFVVRRDGDIDDELQVHLEWDGTGARGVHYNVVVHDGTLNDAGTLLTLAPGVGEARLEIVPIDDGSAGDRTVVLRLRADAAYELGSPTEATVTIRDDSGLPSVTVPDAFIEVTGRASWATFRVQLSEPATAPVTVTVRTFDGTAIAGVHYRAVLETVTIEAGETHVDVRVRILRDAEPGLYFFAALSNPSGAVIPEGGGEGVISLVSPGQALTATALPTTAVVDPPLTDAELAATADAAIAMWDAAGADPVILAELTFAIVELGGQALGYHLDTVIVMDATAAGWGWYVDPDPWTNDGFVRGPDGDLHARPGSDADGRMDLLTVLLHEIGHALGYEHDTFDPDTARGRLMGEHLLPGVRRTLVGVDVSPRDHGGPARQFAPAIPQAEAATSSTARVAPMRATSSSAPAAPMRAPSSSLGPAEVASATAAVGTAAAVTAAAVTAPRAGGGAAAMWTLVAVLALAGALTITRCRRRARWRPSR